MKTNAFGAAALAITSAALAGPPRYRVVDLAAGLDPDQLARGIAEDVSDDGSACGAAYTFNVYGGFLWTPEGNIVLAGHPDRPNDASPKGVSPDARWVVGEAFFDNGTFFQSTAVIYDTIAGDPVPTFPVLDAGITHGYAAFRDVNSAGVAVGTFREGSGFLGDELLAMVPGEALRRRTLPDAAAQDIDYESQQHLSVTESGLVAGSYWRITDQHPDGQTWVFLYDVGADAFVELPSDTGLPVGADGIDHLHAFGANDAGVVVGRVRDDGMTPYTLPLIWEPFSEGGGHTVSVLFDTLHEPDGEPIPDALLGASAIAVNNNGWVIGSAYLDTGNLLTAPRSTLTIDGVTYDLDALAVGPDTVPGPFLTNGFRVRAINDRGWIAAEVDDYDVTGWPVLLVPISECPPDFTFDGVVTLDDIDAFVDRFLGADELADLTADGVLNVNDIEAFVDAFLAGCPPLP